MKGRFKALRFIGTLYKILGIIAGILTLAATVGICFTSILGGTALQQAFNEFNETGSPLLGGMGGALMGVVGGLFLLLNGGLAAAGLYAVGEGIYLMLSIEENTRAMVMKALPVETPLNG